MRRRPIHLSLLFGVLAAIPPVSAAQAQGGVRLSAEVGIGGRYRPNGWIPITVGVVNTGTGVVSGQVQVTSADSGGSAFAVPVNLSAGAAPQSVRVCVRGLDPGSRNVAVSLVDGEERGDGAPQALITSQAGGPRSAFSGVPVSPQDLLLVGLSADPSAITPLTGRQWGLAHTAAGVTSAVQAARTYPGSPSGYSIAPPTVQAAAATPADLPDRSAGYDGVDAVLLRADAPLDALTEAQTDALRAWVATGGHLIVCGGPNASSYLYPFYDRLLPASVATSGVAGEGETLTPKPLPGVRTLAVSDGRPVLVTGPFGAGDVTVSAADATALSPQLWRMILEDHSPTLLSVAAAQESETRLFYNGGEGQLSDAVMRAPSLDAPGAGAVGLFLIGYVLILVPLNYLILKRMDKREWSWATIPALVIVFAAATYAIGDAAKGDSVFINRAAILETTAGRREAGVDAAIGLFSPRRMSYDLTLPDPEVSAADPTTPLRFGYGQPQSGPEMSDPARFVEGGSSTAVQGADVDMWAMRAFDVQSAADLGGVISAPLAHDPRTGTLTGTITNGTPYSLHKCRLFLNGSWQPLADLPPGASESVTGIFPLVASGTDAPGWGPMTAQTLVVGHDARQRMEAALENYVGGLGGQLQYYGGNNASPAVFRPHADEAILMGFCDDSGLGGPDVRVDGHPVTQNSVTCIVVHLPLH